MRIHLDTDLGGDSDDACALAMLLGWPGVEVVGITTVADPGGRRAGYVAHCLELVGRDDVPLAAGAEASLTTLGVTEPIINDERYWSTSLGPRPSSPGAALDLLHDSFEQDATVVAIGPFTNLAMLEVTRPGSLSRVPVVAVGGWFPSAIPGLPDWGPEMDWNVQWDTTAARVVAGAGDLTLVPLPVTLKAHLRAADLPRLRASGPLGRLLAAQGVAHGQDCNMAAVGRAHAGLPDDLLNFQYDPVAVAVAVGWSGTAIDEMRLQPTVTGDVLRFQREPEGRPTRVLVDLDRTRFGETWLSAVEALQRSR
jgi:inosine-uridine nucleoside N-ribohydrolase